MPEPHRFTDLRPGDLVPFFGLTFGIAWGAFALFAFAPGVVEQVLGPPSGSHPLFILAVYAPAIAAFLLVLVRGGLAGLMAFLSRLAIWRAPPVWYAVLFLGLPALFYAGALIKGAPLVPDFESAAAFLAVLGFMAILGPMEEFGWRGVGLPLLQRLMTPFAASIVLGVIWGVWHLPAFLLSGTLQSNWQFLPFVLGATAISVMVTALFNATRGGLLLPMLFHWQLNNPAWPDAQPFDTWLFLAAAGLTLWLCRHTMFSRAGGVTSVIPERGIERGKAAEGL